MDNADKKAYEFFADYIFQHTGIIYKEVDYYRLEMRLKHLCSVFKVESFEALHKLFQSEINISMHNTLIDTSTNNETYFFRDNKPFDVLSKVLYPKLKEELKSSRPIKIWSCGCSTGQEPYGMLISFLENNPGFAINSVDIKATDLSLEALDKAKSGIYTGLEVQRGMPIQLLIKYFKQCEDQKWQLKDDYKSRINFSQFNLVKDHFPSDAYDVIFCRNVIIYQNVENKKYIMEQLFKSLKEDGVLFLGNGESLLGTGINYDQVIEGGCLYFKKSRNKSNAA